MYSLEILVLRCLYEISAWGGVLIGSRILDWGGALLKLAQQKKLKEQVTHMKELCYHMEIEITGMRKKLLSCTNSSVVYTWKVVNKVVVEKGFPCVPIICKSEGGEWGGKGAYLRGELVWHYDPVSGYLFGGLCFLQRGRLFAKLLVELGQWVLTHSLCFFQEKLTTESGT